MSRYLPLLGLALTHAFVDAFALFIEPLWPELRKSLALSQGQLFLLLTVSALAANFSQLGFGYLGDRFGSRYLLWLGPAVAAVTLSCIGFAHDATTLGLFLLLGSVGVGAFHPEGAVTAGAILPEQRTRCLSLFMFGGTIGMGIGPILSGTIVKNFQLPALAWLAIPGVVCIVAINLISQRYAPRAEQPIKAAPVSLRDFLARRGKMAMFLLLVCGLRVVPNAGMTKAIAFTLESQGAKVNVIGFTQSVFLVSGSLGMLLLASHSKHGWERAIMIFSPLLGVPLLAGLSSPDCSQWLMIVLLVLSGIILNGTTPVMVSYSHQLFPQEAGIASSLTMGLSWGVAGMIAAEMTSYFDRIQKPAWMFAAFIPCLILSAAGAFFLPKIREATHPASPDPARETLLVKQ